MLYGSTGYLGGFMVQVLREANRPVHLGVARVENKHDLLDEIKRVRPASVLCLAGIAGKPDIGWCETHQAETISINVVGMLNVADACNSLGVHCTMVTTGGKLLSFLGS